MAASQLIATGTGLATSADQVVAAGGSLTVAIKGATAYLGDVEIQLKDDAGAYWTVDKLGGPARAVVIVGPGTYRIRRNASAESCGVFSG